MFGRAQSSSRQSTQFFLDFHALFFPPTIVPNKIFFGNCMSEEAINVPKCQYVGIVFPPSENVTTGRKTLESGTC
jgi:hypothetical protein